VQIIVPEDSVATPPGNQVPGERIGNLAREEAYSIATFMDDKVDLLTDNNLPNHRYHHHHVVQY
jgi:hypothetical protein